MNGFIVSWRCSYLSSCSCSCVFVVDVESPCTYCFTLSVVFVAAGSVLHVRYKDVLASGFVSSRVFDVTVTHEDAVLRQS